VQIDDPSVAISVNARVISRMLNDPLKQQLAERSARNLVNSLNSMTNTNRPASAGSMTHRLVTAAFGVLFTVIAIIVLIVSDLTIGPILTAAGLGVLGINAMVSAYRNTRSLLSRIGPLP
jgi:hypothetical protein